MGDLAPPSTQVKQNRRNKKEGAGPRFPDCVSGLLIGCVTVFINISAAVWCLIPVKMFKKKDLNV